MSKLYEEFIRLDIDKLKPFEKNLKGELTIVISGRFNKKRSLELSESDKKIIKEMINKLSIKDEYEEYERNAIANNVSDYVDHLESYLMEAINSSNTQFISERGEIERWKGGLDKKQLSKDIKESVSIAKENIEKYRNNEKT